MKRTVQDPEQTWCNYDIVRQSRLSFCLGLRYARLHVGRALFATFSVSKKMARKSFWRSDYSRNTSRWIERPLQPFPFFPFLSGCGIPLSNARSGTCGTFSAPFQFFAVGCLGQQSWFRFPWLGTAGTSWNPLACRTSTVAKSHLAE